jgi:carbon storage regulator
MLVLTRRVGGEIIIDQDICITIMEVRGDRVLLGVTAPREMIVDRGEVHERRNARFPVDAPD